MDWLPKLWINEGKKEERKEGKGIKIIKRILVRVARNRAEKIKMERSVPQFYIVKILKHSNIL